jgi:hypothetical protein
MECFPQELLARRQSLGALAYRKVVSDRLAKAFDGTRRRASTKKELRA